MHSGNPNQPTGFSLTNLQMDGTDVSVNYINNDAYDGVPIEAIEISFCRDQNHPNPVCIYGPFSMNYSGAGVGGVATYNAGSLDFSVETSWDIHVIGWTSLSEPPFAQVNLYSVHPYQGDWNQDGAVNVVDVVLMVNQVLNGGALTEMQLALGDLNQDGEINVVDVVLLVNRVLGNDTAAASQLNNRIRNMSTRGGRNVRGRIIWQEE